jgi:DNA-binding HxlR family transcriptional regulator
VWVGDDDVVHGEHGFDSNKGQHVRGLVTKGYLERSVVPVEQSQDWYPEARTRYSLTPKGRTLCPNAKGA